MLGKQHAHLCTRDEPNESSCVRPRCQVHVIVCIRATYEVLEYTNVYYSILQYVCTSSSTTYSSTMLICLLIEEITLTATAGALQCCYTEASAAETTTTRACRMLSLAVGLLDTSCAASSSLSEAAAAGEDRGRDPGGPPFLPPPYLSIALFGQFDRYCHS